MQNVHNKIEIGYHVYFRVQAAPGLDQVNYWVRMVCKTFDTEQNDFYRYEEQQVAKVFMDTAIAAAITSMESQYPFVELDNAVYFEEVVNRSDSTEQLIPPTEEPTP